MQLNLTTPLAFFDLEATGINIIHDRIVEIAIIKIMPDGQMHHFHTKVHPTILIPAATSRIHGIYDQDVQDAPTFKDIAEKINLFLENCDLAGFNIIRFDIPLFIEEFLRVGVPFTTDDRKIIDVQHIFHIMEKRTLSAAYQFYCGKTLDKAHSAMADTTATLAVFKQQLIRYNKQPVKDAENNTIGVIENDMHVLHQLTHNRKIDFAGRMVYDHNGDAVFNFGKHKGKSILQVLKSTPHYYDWIMKHDFSLDTKNKLTKIRHQLIKDKL